MREHDGQVVGGGRKEIQFRRNLPALYLNPVFNVGEVPLLVLPPPLPRGNRVVADNPPDECFFVPPVRNPSEFKTHSYGRNTSLHDREADFATQLHAWAETKMTSENLTLQQAELARFAADAQQIHAERFNEYLRWVPRNSNNRSRMLQMRTYAHVAHGLAQLAAAITAETVGNYRYLDNITIRWLVGLLADIVAENVLNKHDAAEQWLFNAELWLARDAEGKPRSNLTPYDLVLRNHPRYLARSDNWTDRQDLEAEREPPAEWRKTLLTIGLSFPPVDFSQTVSESKTPLPRRITSYPRISRAEVARKSPDYDD